MDGWIDTLKIKGTTPQYGRVCKLAKSIRNASDFDCPKSTIWTLQIGPPVPHCAAAPPAPRDPMALSMRAKPASARAARPAARKARAAQQPRRAAARASGPWEVNAHRARPLWH